METSQDVTHPTILKESWRFCKTCMIRTWFNLIGAKWFCKTCGKAYLE